MGRGATPRSRRTGRPEPDPRAGASPRQASRAHPPDGPAGGTSRRRPNVPRRDLETVGERGPRRFDPLSGRRFDPPPLLYSPGPRTVRGVARPTGDRPLLEEGASFVP